MCIFIYTCIHIYKCDAGRHRNGQRAEGTTAHETLKQTYNKGDYLSLSL